MNTNLARIITLLAEGETQIIVPASWAEKHVFTDTSVEDFCARFKLTFSSFTKVTVLSGQLRKAHIRRYYTFTAST